METLKPFKRWRGTRRRLFNLHNHSSAPIQSNWIGTHPYAFRARAALGEGWVPLVGYADRSRQTKGNQASFTFACKEKSFSFAAAHRNELSRKIKGRERWSERDSEQNCSIWMGWSLVSLCQRKPGVRVANRKIITFSHFPLILGQFCVNASKRAKIKNKKRTESQIYILFVSFSRVS